MSAKKKEPWEMPEPPADIAKIIDKLDNGIKLSPQEHKDLEKWEDSVGGFGGFMNQVPQPEKKAQ